MTMKELAERCEQEAKNWRGQPLEACLLEAAHWLKVEAKARASQEPTQ